MMITPKQVTNDPKVFAEKFLRIRDKEKNLVPFLWNRAQRDFHFKRTGRDLILKARQLGFTTYVQGEKYRRKVTSTRATITMAHDHDTTQIIRRMEDRFHENCKFGNVQPARHYANAGLATYPDFDSESLIATAGSKAKGRGGSYTDFHGSEVAFWTDAEKIVAGAMQGGRADVILESTPNGAQGYFYERCNEALRGDGIWTLHFYSWWWDDDYRIPLDEGETIQRTDEETKLAQAHGLDDEQIKWRRYKQDELKGFFIQEYPEDPLTCFLTSGNSYFGDMSKMFIAPSDPEYNLDHVYVGGLDFGQTDFTALPVLDYTTKEQVDLLHINKTEWGEQRKRIKSVYNKWSHSICENGHITKGLFTLGFCKCGGAFSDDKRMKLGAEMNSIGAVNIDALRDDGVNLVGFTTTNASKAEVMSDLYSAFHTDGLKLLDIPAQKQEFYSFVSTQTATGIWRLAASGDAHDDIVMAWAIAWWAATIPSASELIAFI